MDPASLSGGLLFDLAWISEPTAWVGLLTLTLMQVVLGLDNLLFIAILSAKNIKIKRTTKEAPRPK